jgi:pimeloyl-ACP methyl ester carboxylesterase
MSRRLAIGACLLTLATVTACTSSSGSSATSGSSSSTVSAPSSASGSAAGSAAASGSAGTAGYVEGAAVDFAACPANDDPKIDMTGFDCATATVPLDWQAPTRETISLAVVKHPAGNQAQKIGTLMFNPGGPGGTGTSEFPQWIDAFPQELRDRFDIVSWDPRGIGESTAVQCWDAADEMGEAYGPVSGYPTDDAQKRAWLPQMAAIGQACGARNGDLLAHVSTADTARDLEALRISLGNEKLNYLGVSYGTFLGATYTNLFPDHIRSMVLDGNLDPNNWTNGGQPATTSINQRIGTDRGIADDLDAFFALCGQADTSACAFSAGSAEATKAKYDQMLAQLDAQPVTLPSGRSIGGQDLATDMGNAMFVVQPNFGAQGWSGTAKVLQTVYEAMNAPASSGAAASGASSSAAPASSASSGGSSAATAAPSSGAPAAQSYTGPEQAWAVMCGDAAVPPQSSWPAIGDQTLAKYGPSSAGAVWGDAVCVDWPTRAAQPYLGPWNADPGVTVLLIGNTHDPSTPFSNTEGMATVLRRTSVLTVEGYGHTMLLNPSSCGSAHEVAYFIDGTLPPAGTVCPQDRAPFAQ